MSGRAVKFRLALALLACGNVVKTAAAQERDVVVLPARGDERLAAQREVAQHALVEALEGQGFDVIAHAQAIERLPDGARACAAVDCAPNMLRALSVPQAAACAVWLSPDAPEGTVFVTLVDGAGARYPGAHAVQAGELAIATRAALADALSLQMLGPGPWVRVHGEPAGARVLIDGELAGTLPYRAAMTAGRYSLRVEAPGYIHDEQVLDVPLNAGRVLELHVSLVAGEDTETSEPAAEGGADAGAAEPDRLRDQPIAHDARVQPAEAGPAAADYLLGAAFVVPGLLLATIDPVAAAAKRDDCVDASCRERYTFGTRTTLELVGGVALIAAGAVVTFVWKPFSVGVTAGQTTSVQLRTQF